MPGDFTGHDLNCRGEIFLEVSGLESESGVVRVSLFDSRENWNRKKDSFRHVAMPVADGRAVALFHDIPPGIYAVMLYHDSNGNDMFDTNFMGIPVEDYGFSNNVRPFFSLPSFRSASFMVGCGRVRLNISVQ
jgi:uncharacterized protein (DUF2141 family)